LPPARPLSFLVGHGCYLDDCQSKAVQAGDDCLGGDDGARVNLA